MCPQKTSSDTNASTLADTQAQPEKPKAISHPDYEELEAQLNEVETQLNAATAAIEDYKSQQLRNHAELDNIRKRAEKDVQSAHKYGLERFVTELLPVIDSLERGMIIEVGDNEFAKQIHAGIEMTHKLFMDSLEKFSIKPVDPLGSIFDPALHQAIAMQEEANVAANTVLQVLQKGYLLNDRLVRPALVVVAK